ncbi:MAG TPA: winged helix-turn-helix domain-containing protein, partial [Novosphingobium sp.]|nr:winged helix-turn-helix domain-containing protein [Novosphingobium sp.]
MDSRATGFAGLEADELARTRAGEDSNLRLPVELAVTPPFTIGELQVEPATRRVLYLDGESETLEPRVMETFVALYRAGGAVMSRDDLLAACWRGTVVGEDAIQRVIQRLRKVAGRSHAFSIETITKAGYRLIPTAAETEGVRGDAPSLAVLP